MQRIAIVDPSETSREALRTSLLGVDFVWLEAVCAKYEYFDDVIKSSVPDLVIVALDSDRNRALMMISQICAQYPKLPILTISSDHQALLQSLQRGARYFLTLPLEFESLLTSLRRALNESGTYVQGPGVPDPGTRSTLTVALLGSRGGVGCTTIGVNLAATLAADPNNNVALIDLDLALGDADIVMDMSQMDTLSMADVARNIERLDMNFLKRAAARHPETGVSLLRHPLEMHEISLIHEGHVERILNLLRISYNHMILDLSKGLLPTDLMGLRLADVILLVAQLDLSSLRNVVRMLHTLQIEDNLAEKVRVVVNRVGGEGQEDPISLKKAEEVIGKSIFWQIPNDSKAVAAARIEGKPLIQFAPRSRVQQSMAGMAAALCGKTSTASAPPDKPGKGSGWGRFFGRS
ncbi:nucleotide-binding protein [Tuwongella immobilis]|uniref:Response regulatory domain-containing protein n=1 Tax=Tuwongella immobilis TaxID=692036 RepID=A0A6C2YVD1_9BACT|nr:AAA family ATPase [Tuwongella immobilis]VIP05404.1 response regulator receiver protein : Response regulator receiver protein OS=Pirellula staleyi (strain ATCC 27377 / DSM 6068 / ICPB 4128) GN=Psta_2077 PE=4 SV=1: Response_reg: AAA_31 [Tuwongella immobilis]VTS08164.1 response regulator receiver protein : Response regulator receiver protein OS=Pirellula staleyi (strain ATCC 27377 / DSM 6068 / ICPB 4128) GN=Psta_2077 PE=4 SV=1: Response_reg: AAA_31 [Tuwongella immobilis]